MQTKAKHQLLKSQNFPDLIDMTVPEILSIVASIIGIVGGPLSVYFAWRAAQRAGQAVAGADQLSRRLTARALYREGSMEVLEIDLPKST